MNLRHTAQVALTVLGGGALIGVVPAVASATADATAVPGEPPVAAAETAAPSTGESPARAPAPAPQAPPAHPIAPAPEPVELEVSGAIPSPPARRPHGGARRAPSPTRAAQRGASATAPADPGGAPATARPQPGGALLDELPAALVPDFFIRSFRIPPFLLPIYQAAGIEYGIRWEVLAAINEIETDYGRNLGVSTAGALGWMQFLPSTWATYGIDASGDGRRDPRNPLDAVFAAARYLRAAGAADDLRRALYAYNHAEWYVEAVLARARRIAGTPAALVDAVAGLSRGRLPAGTPARYGGAAGRDRRGLTVRARPGSAVVAVQDGEIVKVGRSARLGRFVMLRDAYANTYTYGHLGTVAARVQLPAQRPAPAAARAPVVTERLFANPGRSRSRRAGGGRQLLQARALRASRPGRLVAGRRIAAGTVLGRIGQPDAAAPGMRFEIRPAGDGAPRIDPLPIVRGWRLLDTVARRADRRDPAAPTLGQVLLMSKRELTHRVLADHAIRIPACGRRDIRAGAVDRRVLATLAYLAASDLAPTVGSLRCGAGGAPAHASGNAVDIAKVNGIPLAGRGRGTIGDRTVRTLLSLQGTLAPAQVISLPDRGHVHVGFAGATAGRGAPGGAALRAAQWRTFIERVDAIVNPIVPATPSRTAPALPSDRRPGG